MTTATLAAPSASAPTLTPIVEHVEGRLAQIRREHEALEAFIEQTTPYDGRYISRLSTDAKATIKREFARLHDVLGSVALPQTYTNGGAPLFTLTDLRRLARNLERGIAAGETLLASPDLLKRYEETRIAASIATKALQKLATDNAIRFEEANMVLPFRLSW